MDIGFPYRFCLFNGATRPRPSWLHPESLPDLLCDPSNHGTGAREAKAGRQSSGGHTQRRGGGDHTGEAGESQGWADTLPRRKHCQRKATASACSGDYLTSPDLPSNNRPPRLLDGILPALHQGLTQTTGFPGLGHIMSFCQGGAAPRPEAKTEMPARP